MTRPASVKTGILRAASSGGAVVANALASSGSAIVASHWTDTLAESVARIEQGDGARREQDPAGATYAPKIAPDAGRLTLDCSADELVRRVRAFTPEPGAYLPHGAERLAVLSAEADGDAGAPPGSVIDTYGVA